MCCVCAELIKRNRRIFLATRVIAVKEQEGFVLGPQLRPMLEVLYRRLRRNINGAIRRIESP